MGAKGTAIIFGGGVYVAENTFRGAQCRIVRQRRIIEASLHCPPLADNRGFPMSAIRTHWERRSSGMTELSALAGSEGYAACDDDGGLCCQKKGRREPFLTVSASGEIPRTPASVFGCCQQTFTIQPRVSGILPHCMPVSSSYSLWVRDPILLSFITCSTSL